MPFSAYPSAFVYDIPGPSTTQKPVQQLVWGDWLKRLGPEQGQWVKVHARNETGWMRREDIQENRLLEVNFVDIGQGDGCLIVTPKDRFIIVDAGESDNMYRFLRWRFGGFKKRIFFESAVITHPDQDHYGGFEPLVQDHKVYVRTVYHNGLVERKGSRRLGPRTTSGTPRYLTDVIADRKALKSLLDDPDNRGRMPYPNLLKDALDSGRIRDIRMLSAADDFMPGYGRDKDLSIRVLGPVPEPGADGKRRLRWLGSDGETKNGHSVILQLHYGVVTILLGGDLNVPAEEYLLSHYTGLDPRPRSAVEEEMLIQAARRTFESDITKACHHGSADFTELFLQAINPVTTVVSSGDDEPYSHPRADALGALGRYGRGQRPLIFSTELARSTRENIKAPHVLRTRITELADQLDRAETDAQKSTIRKQLEAEIGHLERSVAVYGMIALRTDGQKVLLTQKLERPGPRGTEWDLYRLEPGPDSRLRYINED